MILLRSRCNRDSYPKTLAGNPYVRQIGVVTLCESFQNKETKHTRQQLELRKLAEHPWRKKVEQNPCNPRDISSTAKLDLTDRKANFPVNGN